MSKTERIRSVSFDNRRKVITVGYTSNKKIDLHYGQLGLTKKIVAVWVDKETQGKSVGIRFLDGSEDYMPYDQPLALARDSDYLLRTQIERVVAHIKRRLLEKHISKRYLAEQLGTSYNQIQRLLDPTILNKNLEQLYRIGRILGLEFEWTLKEAV